MEIGFALMKNKKIIKVEKGVNLDVRNIAKILRNTDYDWALFHTRLASMGNICDQNCHPFRRKNVVMAMNGTEKSVNFLSKIRDITDTEAILETIDKYNLSLAVLKNFSSIFVGFFNGKPFVVADNIYNIKILNNKKNKALVFASSFPTKFKHNIYKPTENFIWTGGELPNTFEKYKRKYTRLKYFSDYIYHKDLYEQCYIEALDKGGEN